MTILTQDTYRKEGRTRKARLLRSKSTEKMNLLCIYQTNTRRGSIYAIKYMQQYLEPDETELTELSNSLLEKLEQMSDEEFDEMEKIPDFG